MAYLRTIWSHVLMHALEFHMDFDGDISCPKCLLQGPCVSKTKTPPPSICRVVNSGSAFNMAMRLPLYTEINTRCRAPDKPLENKGSRVLICVPLDTG